MNDDELTGDEGRLAKALGAGLPPAHDPLFRIAVLERRERGLLRRRIVMTVAVAAIVLVMGSLVLVSLADTNADMITAWLTEDLERIAVPLTILASACFTLSAIWLTAADGMLAVLRTWRRRLWV